MPDNPVSAGVFGALGLPGIGPLRSDHERSNVSPVINEARPAGYAAPAELAVLVEQASRVLRLEVDFPQLVLTDPRGSLRWTDSDYLGWAPLRDFARLHQDTDVSVLVPGAVRRSWRRGVRTSIRLGFTVTARASTDEFETLLGADGGAQYQGSLAMFGPSGRWAVFGEPDLAAWWSVLPADAPELSAWELKYRPWAYSADEAADLWSLAFNPGIPEELRAKLRANYGAFDREDREASMPEISMARRSLREFD